VWTIRNGDTMGSNQEIKTDAEFDAVPLPGPRNEFYKSRPVCIRVRCCPPPKMSVLLPSASRLRRGSPGWRRLRGVTAPTSLMARAVMAAVATVSTGVRDLKGSVATLREPMKTVIELLPGDGDAGAARIGENRSAVAARRPILRPHPLASRCRNGPALLA
jgi:hypothetical protein